MKTSNFLLFLFTAVSWIPSIFGAPDFHSVSHATPSYDAVGPGIVEYSYKGVPLDYSYNQTAHSPDDFVSVPGCPKSIDGFPWVLFKKGNEIRCYLSGHQADVCNATRNDVMHIKLESQFGVCSCGFTNCVESINANVTREGRYTFCTKNCEELVDDEVEKTCQQLYQQGSCGQNKWLSRDGLGGIECRPRLCFGDQALFGEEEKRYSANKHISADDISCCSPRNYDVPRPQAGFGSAFKTSCPLGKVYRNLLRKCRLDLKNSLIIIG